MAGFLGTRRGEGGVICGAADFTSKVNHPPAVAKTTSVQNENEHSRLQVLREEWDPTPLSSIVLFGPPFLDPFRTGLLYLAEGKAHCPCCDKALEAYSLRLWLGQVFAQIDFWLLPFHRIARKNEEGAAVKSPPPPLGEVTGLKLLSDPVDLPAS